MEKRFVLISATKKRLDVLERHIHILKTLQKNEPAGIFKLSELTEYSSHLVRSSLRALEQEGLIKPSRKGAVTTDAVSKTIPLLKTKLKEMNKTIDKLIETLG